MGTDQLLLDSKSVGVLRSRLGENVVVSHPVGYEVQTLATNGLIDAVIVDTEDGFSQLGQMRHFLSADLGLTERNLVKYVLDGFPDKLERNISSLADWNRARAEVTLVAIPSERPDSFLKGVILSPYERSECYSKFVYPTYHKPYRDFFYNVTYEAISFAYRTWNARRIGIASYHGCKSHDHLTTCQVEAMAHFCNEHSGVESFTFLDSHKGNCPLDIVSEFNSMADIGSHRAIHTKELEFWGISFIDLDWTMPIRAVEAPTNVQP